MPNIDANILDAFRRWGYLQADLDWLGRLESEPHRELDIEAHGVETARRWYCGTLAVEFMHIPDPERRRWVQERMEDEPAAVDRAAILELLMRAAVFEEFLQTRYIGTKRFSIEGVEALLPLLAEALHRAAEREARTAVLAMSHRGRLNVMAHIAGKDPRDLFAGFEDVDPRSVMGAGDVKYHLGATGSFAARNGSEVKVHLVSNPSHLEAVDPVAIGRAKAKQIRLGDEAGRQVAPILLHGDAALAGQGITAETINLAGVEGFAVGGALHVVVNNLIGFTTPPAALHTSRFASDVAKRLPIPIFHVNGEDPDAVVRAAHIALDYRFAFRSDVVVDLIGFRRHGHSEVDDPTVTQPLLYRQIEARPPLWTSFGERLGLDAQALSHRADEIRAELATAKEAAAQLDASPRLSKLPDYWSPFFGGAYKSDYELDTGVARDDLERLSKRLTDVPRDFDLHPKLAKLLEQRAAMGRGEAALDFGMAEALAFAALVESGIPVRLSGQDSRRGTFNHRHAVLIDQSTATEYCPLCHIADTQARFDIYDSVLSEASVLGFEYGYSRDMPEALVVWEAQFGDFVNGAQVILDQFVTAGEDKWGLLSGLVMLLPHGFEGQGPEHSSARVERFLQLAAEDAIQVTQPSIAAQYFHLLRRQVLRRWRKPLIALTPKSMLRNAAAFSPLDDLGSGRFQPLLADPRVSTSARRLLLCSGKIAHELRAERERRQREDTAIVTLEQLYPFPEQELRQLLERHAHAREILWVQEEPANMGALGFVVPRIAQLSGGRHVRSIKRSASASPATGSTKAHRIEQQTLLSLAFA